MKKIVVLIDFSECSLNALKSALEISKKTGAELILTHWYSKPYQLNMSVAGGKSSIKVDNTENEKYKKEVFALMDDTLLKIGSKGVKISKYLVFEKEFSDMMKIDFFTTADLIVMGTKGVSGLNEIFIGSVAQKVVRYAKCPVLVAKDFVDYLNLDNIIFVSDFEKEEAVIGFQNIKPLLDISNAQLHLLKVITPAKFENSNVTEAKMNDFIKKTKLDNCTKYFYNSNSIEIGISDYVNRFEKPMICIATRGLTGFSSLMGSLTEGLVNGLDKPLLSINIGKE